MKVYIVGMGPGHPDFLTIQGKRAVEESRVILGDRRMTEAFSSLGKNIISTYKPSEIRRVLASMEDGDGPAAVVVSGDVGFFSLGRLLTDIPGCTVISCPGISSLAYFAAKVRTLVYNKAFLALLSCKICKRCPEKSRADYKIIVLFHCLQFSISYLR